MFSYCVEAYKKHPHLYNLYILYICYILYASTCMWLFVCIFWLGGRKRKESLFSHSGGTMDMCPALIFLTNRLPWLLQETRYGPRLIFGVNQCGHSYVVIVSACSQLFGRPCFEVTHLPLALHTLQFQSGFPSDYFAGSYLAGSGCRLIS